MSKPNDSNETTSYHVCNVKTLSHYNTNKSVQCAGHHYIALLNICLLSNCHHCSSMVLRPSDFYGYNVLQNIDLPNWILWSSEKSLVHFNNTYFRWVPRWVAIHQFGLFCILLSFSITHFNFQTIDLWRRPFKSMRYSQKNPILNTGAFAYDKELPKNYYGCFDEDLNFFWKRANISLISFQN